MFVSYGLVLGFDVGACGGCVVLGGDSSFGGCGCGGRRGGCLGGRGFYVGRVRAACFLGFFLFLGGFRGLGCLGCLAGLLGLGLLGFLSLFGLWFLGFFGFFGRGVFGFGACGVLASSCLGYAALLCVFFLLEVDGVAFFVHDAVLQVGQRLVGDEAEADAEVAAPASVKA